MTTRSSSEITALLMAWHRGDHDAGEELMEVVYGQLRHIARRYMRDERRQGQIQTTELVHEAYLRLVDLEVDWEGRNHFFGLIARLMRNVLVDMARHNIAAKRGAGESPRPLLDIDLPMARPGDLLALDDALSDLGRFDPRKVQILEMRYFAGMSNEQIAGVLETSISTVERQQRLARSWLASQLSGEVSPARS
ncbi:MAG: ECF-type sigma factor [Acidobacteriota bacterium]